MNHINKMELIANKKPTHTIAFIDKWSMRSNPPIVSGQQPSDWVNVFIADLDFSKLAIGRLPNNGKFFITYGGKNLSLRFDPGGIWCWSISKDQVYDTSNKTYLDIRSGTYSMPMYTSVDEKILKDIDQDNLHKCNRGLQTTFMTVAFFTAINEYLAKQFGGPHLVAQKLTLSKNGNISFKSKPPVLKPKNGTKELYSASNPQKLNLAKIRMSGSPTFDSDEALLAKTSSPFEVCGTAVPYLTVANGLIHLGLTWTDVGFCPMEGGSSAAMATEIDNDMTTYVRNKKLNELVEDIQNIE